MGRWAQRTRQGGSQVVFNQMIDAEISGSGQDQAQIEYMTTQNLTALSAGDFTSNPSGEIGDSIASITDKFVTVQFLNPLTGDTSLTYAGSVVNFIHPQTINY